MMHIRICQFLVWLKYKSVFTYICCFHIGAMPVSIDVCYSISFNDSPPWRVKRDMVKVIQGTTFVKLRPYDPTLCNVVLVDFLGVTEEVKAITLTDAWVESLA